jgi:hypothetical protein
MNRANAMLSNAVIVALTFSVGAVVGTIGDVRAQDLPAPPSSFYIATNQPEYFDGRPVYWYHNNWFYRDGQRWSYYRSEPAYLRDRRAGWGSRARFHYHR